MFFRRNQDQGVQTKTKKKEDDNLEWDKRRIFFSLCILVAALVIANEVKSQFFPNASLGDAAKTEELVVEKPSVKPPNIDLQSQVGSKIKDIKQSIGELKPQEVASSSPQIQKVLRDIQGIKDLPSNEAKEMCMKICGGI